MSIRITQGHLFSRALQDIHRGLRGFNLLQQQVATGRRVNRPSDDPAASLQIIPLNNDLRGLRQLSDNVALARETLDTGAASLEDASTLMQRVRELTMQAANDTTAANDRSSIGNEMNQLLEQLVGIANARRGDRHLFGGTESSDTPFEISNTGGTTQVLYRGNHDRLNINVAPGVTTALNIAGDSIFQSRDRNGVTISGNTGARATLGGSGSTAVGFQSLNVTFAGLHTDAPATITAGIEATNAVGPLTYAFTVTPPTLSIGGGPAIHIPASDANFVTADGRTINLSVSGVPATLAGTFTARANLSTDGGASTVTVTDFTHTSLPVTNSNDGSVLMLDLTSLSKTGTDSVKHEGTFDAFTVLVTLRDLMRNTAGLPDSTVRARASQMLTEIDGAHDAVLDGLRELGFRSSSMQILGNRVAGLELSRQESLSTLQDTDMSQAILDMQRHELGYQAALQVSARVIQTSLQNYLR
ncbi:MAG: flagellar hook-associated protein 3 [Planctomycetes bacterium]|nr:flagellar hook-associated protein 3 [Planctomycetota bacterium]